MSYHTLYDVTASWWHILTQRRTMTLLKSTIFTTCREITLLNSGTRHTHYEVVLLNSNMLTAHCKTTFLMAHILKAHRTMTLLKPMLHTRCKLTLLKSTTSMLNRLCEITLLKSGSESEFESVWRVFHWNHPIILNSTTGSFSNTVKSYSPNIFIWMGFSRCW